VDQRGCGKPRTLALGGSRSSRRIWLSVCFPSRNSSRSWGSERLSLLGRPKGTPPHPKVLIGQRRSARLRQDSRRGGCKPTGGALVSGAKDKVGDLPRSRRPHGRDGDRLATSDGVPLRVWGTVVRGPRDQSLGSAPSSSGDSGLSPLRNQKAILTSCAEIGPSPGATLRRQRSTEDAGRQPARMEDTPYQGRDRLTGQTREACGAHE
jgi:hypothetical protein